MHNGKLWCCTKCIVNDKWSGNTTRLLFKKHLKPPCIIYEGDLFQVKDPITKKKFKECWGRNQENQHHLKPYGCPSGHTGPATKPDNYRPKPKFKAEPESPPRKKAKNASVQEPAPEESAPVPKPR